ncbi:MAG: PDDEXK nuclease domain-containing protein [Endomicrobia bacterium]|nr:PDDEXK nuclease domain-containing protein [Endomicrobiia bacterium]
MNFNYLVKQIQSIQNALQASAVHAINTALTIRNWLIGYYIVEFEQKGQDRAKYGEKLLQKLSKQLRIKGLEERRLRDFRQFYITYPQISDEIHSFLPDISIRHLSSAKTSSVIRHSASAELKLSGKMLVNKLSYTHLRWIMKIDNPAKRAFYEIEAIKGCWSVAELERQINTLYYERSGLSKNKKALSALANSNSVELKPRDIVNTPIALEFLGLNERALVTETDLEQAILDHIQQFLLEMGRGFCFEARQKRILIGNDYFFADLVFYHRILKCLVIVELKIDKFKHEYASQLNMYLNYFKAEEMSKGDNAPIGILLCADKDATQVKYATAGLDKNIFVKKYMIALPKEKELKEYIEKEIKEQNFIRHKE